MGKYGQKMSTIFGLYASMLPVYARRLLFILMKKLDSSVCEGCFIKQLKLFTNSAVPYILNTRDLGFLYLLDLEQLMGYDTELNRLDDPKAVFSDFSVDNDTAIPPAIYSNINRIIDGIGFSPIKCSFDQFIAFRDAWATSSSSTHGKPLKMTVSHGKRSRTISLASKFFKLAKLSNRTISKMCWYEDDVICKPFLKSDEPAKSRWVVSYSTLSYLRCTYLTMGIADLRATESWSSLDMDPVRKFSLRQKLLEDPSLYRLCMDQSSFDLNQPKHLVTYAIRRLIRRIQLANPGNPDVRNIGNKEIDSLSNVVIQVGNERRPWKKGLLSGYKWTALIGSILNAATSRYVMTKNGLDVKTDVYQGDDAIALVSSRPNLNHLASQFASLNMVLNPSKTWDVQGKGEYLHELYMDGIVYGYPSRSARSLLWKKPSVSSAGTIGEIGVRENLDNILRAGRRGLVGAFTMAKFFLKRKFNNLSSNMIDEFLCTPKCLGGVGFLGSGRVSGIFEKTVSSKFRMSQKVKNTVILPDMTYSASWGIIQSKFTREMAFPGITTQLRLIKLNPPSRQAFLPAGTYLPQQLQPLRLDWTINDYFRVPDPYERRGLLAWCLLRRKGLPAYLSPDHRIVARNPYQLCRLISWLTNHSILYSDLSTNISLGDSLARTGYMMSKAWESLLIMIANSYITKAASLLLRFSFVLHIIRDMVFYFDPRDTATLNRRLLNDYFSYDISNKIGKRFQQDGNILLRV